MKALDIIGEFEEAWPQQRFAAGAPLICRDDPTDRAYIIIDGLAQASRRQFAAGDLVNVIEFLALETYLTPVRAKQSLRAYVLSRDHIRDLCSRLDQLAWPLSCMLAIDISKRSPNLRGEV